MGSRIPTQAPPVEPEPGLQHDRRAADSDQRMDTSTYFNLMAKLMGGAAPPAPEDAPMLARWPKSALSPASLST